jgi:hypothetical protein
MSYAVSTWREPSSKTAYVTTGKEASPTGEKIDLACWLLQGRIDEKLHGSGTVGDVYYGVTRPMGMSLDETKTLVKECKKRGYLK